MPTELRTPASQSVTGRYRRTTQPRTRWASAKPTARTIRPLTTAVGEIVADPIRTTLPSWCTCSARSRPLSPNGVNASVAAPMRTITCSPAESRMPVWATVARRSPNTPARTRPAHASGANKALHRLSMNRRTRKVRAPSTLNQKTCPEIRTARVVKPVRTDAHVAITASPKATATKVHTGEAADGDAPSPSPAGFPPALVLAKIAAVTAA